MPKSRKPPDKASDLPTLPGIQGVDTKNVIEQQHLVQNTGTNVQNQTTSKQKGKRNGRVDPIEYHTIKVPATGLLKKKKEIADLVCKMNILTMRAYELLRLYVISTFNTTKDKDDAEMILELPMYKYALALVSNTANTLQTPKNDESKDVYDKKIELKKLYDDQFSNLLLNTGSYFNSKDCTNFSCIFEKTAEEMKTCYENNIQMRFTDNLKLVLKYKLSEEIVKKGSNHERILKFAEDKGLPEPDDALLKKLHNYIKYRSLKYAPSDYKPLVQAVIKDDRIRIKNNKRAMKVYNALRVMDHNLVPDDDTELGSLYDEVLEHYLPYDLNLDNFLEYDIKVDDHLGKYFMSLLKMTHYFESLGQKLGQMCPLRSSEIPSHITIQQKYIERTFKADVDKISDSLSKEERAIKVFNVIMDMNNSVFKRFRKRYGKVPAVSDRSGWVFYNTFDTDGVSCSLTFARYKMFNGERQNPGRKQKDVKEEILITNEEVYSKRKKEVLSKQILVGVDPGKSTLISMIDEQDNMFNYTNNQRRHETLANHYGRKRKYLFEMPYQDNLSVKKIEVALSETRPKSLKVENFLEYVKTKIRVGDSVRPLYQKVIFRKMSLVRHIKERQSIAKLTKAIKRTYGEKDKEIVLGYGNWSRDTQMKGCPPSPGASLRRKLEKQAKQVGGITVCLVSEYNTSKACNRCGCKKFTHKKVQNKIDGVRKLHRVLICKECVSRKDSHCILNNRYVNRDKNAARNILEAFKAALEGKERPEHLRPSPKEEDEESNEEDEEEEDSSLSPVNFQGVEGESIINTESSS